MIKSCFDNGFSYRTNDSSFSLQNPLKAHNQVYTQKHNKKKSQIKILCRLVFLGENQYEVDVYATFTSQASLNE